MCCLFGLIDVKHQLSGSEKNRIISILAEASEVRGIDATGYACNSHGKLIIEKQPLPAHRVKFRIPKEASVIMGHTRMTTQGDAHKNKNNHPFIGKVNGIPFALAHNGVLTNDISLRKTNGLPRTKIETDSYVAVQLLEKKSSLDLDSVKFMAEQVKGTFNFTIPDRDNRFFLVKGNNPMCLRYFKEAGIYLYASTKAILEEALKTLGYDQLPYEQIQVCDGEILMIDGKGKIERAYFTPPVNINSLPIYTCWEPIVEAPSSYRKSLMDYGIGIGVPKQELEWLHYAGYTTYDLEEAIYNKNYRIMCLWESGYYDEMEDTLYEINYESHNCYAWA